MDAKKGKNSYKNQPNYAPYPVCVLSKIGELEKYDGTFGSEYENQVNRENLYKLVNESVIGDVFDNEKQRKSFYKLTQNSNAPKDIFYDHCC